MNTSKLNRLNDLFEKSVDDKISVVEMRQLRSLYEEYINEGRDVTRRTQQQSHRRKLHLAS